MIILCNPSTMFMQQTRNELHIWRRRNAYAKKQKKKNLSKNRSQKRKQSKVPHKVLNHQTFQGTGKKEKLNLILRIIPQLLTKKNNRAGITLCSSRYPNTHSKNIRSSRQKNKMKKRSQERTMLKCLQMKMMRIQIPSLKRKKTSIK